MLSASCSNLEKYKNKQMNVLKKFYIHGTLIVIFFSNKLYIKARKNLHSHNLIFSQTIDSYEISIFTISILGSIYLIVNSN